MDLEWTRIAGGGVGGSWSDPEIRAARPSVVHNGRLYVGVYGERLGSAAVWSFDGSRWAAVYEAEATGHAFNRINALEIWRGSLAIGAGIKGKRGSATVLLLDEAQHTIDVALSCEAIGASFIDSLSVYEGRLAVGLGGGEGALEHALALVGEQGTDLVAPSHPIDGTYAMSAFRGRLVTGSYDRDRLTSLSVLDGTGALPRLRPLARTKPDADRDKGGIVEALTVFRDWLFANFDRPVSLDTAESRVAEGTSPVWWFDGACWYPALGTAVPDILARAANFNSSVVFRDRFLFSSGSVGNRSGSLFVRVWALDPARGTVTPVGGGGIGGSWRDEAVGAANPRRLAWIYSMNPFADGLAATFTYGLGGGQAEIWLARPR